MFHYEDYTKRNLIGNSKSVDSEKELLSSMAALMAKVMHSPKN